VTRLDELRAKVEAGLPLLLSEASVVLDCSVDYLFKLIRSGQVCYGRKGRLYRLPAGEVVRLGRETGVIRTGVVRS
jgi:hypothetical protein